MSRIAEGARRGVSQARKEGVPSDRARDTLAALRGRIDELDAQLLALLGERYRVVARVQEVKQKSGDGLWVPSRERAQLERLERLNREAGSPLRAEALRAIFGEILAASRALQGPLSVAYLGPPGTYSERAAREQFGSSAQLVSVASIAEVFRAVERGETALGIVPIENSTEGMVGPTLDALVTTPTQIVAEHELAIRHALLARCRRISDVRRIVSHPQSLAQCREWLARKLPGVPTMEVASNSLAAAAAARGTATAAIAGRDAAEIYGLRVLADNIQDLARNVTRFVVAALPETVPAGGGNKISLLFTVRNEPGRLLQALEPFASAGIDLFKLESRPMRGRPWEYLFFVDVRGQIGSPAVERALAAAERTCVWLKVLGAYAEARPA